MTTLEASARVVQRPKHAVEELCILAERHGSRLTPEALVTVIDLIETAEGSDPGANTWDRHLRSGVVRASVRSLLCANRELRIALTSQAVLHPAIGRATESFVRADIGIEVVPEELAMTADDVDDLLRLTECTHLGARLADSLALVHSGSSPRSDVRDEARWLNLGEIIAVEAGRVLDLVREFSSARRVFTTMFVEQPFVALGVRSAIERSHAAFETPQLLKDLGVKL